MLNRLITVFGGAVLIVVGVLIPATAPYLIPAGSAVIGWAIPHISDIS